MPRSTRNGLARPLTPGPRLTSLPPASTDLCQPACLLRVETQFPRALRRRRRTVDHHYSARARPPSSAFVPPPAPTPASLQWGTGSTDRPKTFGTSLMLSDWHSAVTLRQHLLLVGRVRGDCVMVTRRDTDFSCIFISERKRFSQMFFFFKRT